MLSAHGISPRMRVPKSGKHTKFPAFLDTKRLLALSGHSRFKCLKEDWRTTMSEQNYLLRLLFS